MLNSKVLLLYIYVCVYIYIHVCICICVCIYVYMYVYMCVYIYIHTHAFFFNILFHYGLWHDIESSSLSYTVEPHCLPILMYNSSYLLSWNFPSISVPARSPLTTTNLFSVCECPSISKKFTCVRYYIPHISDTIWYLSVSVWLASLRR